MTSEDCRIVNKVMDDMDMTTEIAPMCTNIFTSHHPAPAPPAPPAPAPHAPPTPPHPTPPTPPHPTPPTSPHPTINLNLTTNPTTPTHSDVAPPTIATSSPVKKVNKRKRKRCSDEEDDCPPPPCPPPPCPPPHPQNTTLNCCAFPKEIARYVEYLRPGWDRHFSDGMMTLILFTGYRYAKQNQEVKWNNWKKSMFDITEMFNDTYLHAAEHVKKYCECAMKVILMHASMTACHSNDSPVISRDTMKMVRQVLKFDHTVDVIGLAMMTDGIDKVDYYAWLISNRLLSIVDK